MSKLRIGDKRVGDGEKIFITAEIGINHNGSLPIAKNLIDVAVKAGCDAVKFQKRNPEAAVPEKYKNLNRETPWGVMSYIKYKKKIEFGKKEYSDIDQYCKKRQILWFASCWDEQSVDFIDDYNPPCYKIASASLTDKPLLKYTQSKGKPMVLSTGMSTLEEINSAVKLLGEKDLVILHCTSTYPANLNELNLKMIKTLKKLFSCPIGYSGHETGVSPSVIAAVLGACFIERHITLDRSMWGSDQAASLEPKGLEILVRDISQIKAILGDGTKKVYDSELPIRQKLRRYM